MKGTRLDSKWLFATDTFVWGLQGMCHLQRIPFAPNLVLQQVAPPYTLNSLQHAAETLGLKAGVKLASVNDLASLPLPCLAVLRPAAAPDAESAANDAGGTAQPESPPHRLVLVLKANNAKVLLFDEKSKNPFEAGLKEFESQYAGQVMLFQATSKAAVEGDPMLQQKKEFGFSWFIPELLKHQEI